MAGGRGWLNGARRRDVIGRNRVAEDAEGSRVSNFFDPARFHSEILKEGRLVDVIALLVPLVDLADARRDLIPFWILRAEVTIQALENFRRKCRTKSVADFL